jgi:hypothetical protein
MTVYKSARKRLSLEALRRAIELRDSETMLGFYAEDAQVHVLNGDALQSPPFEIRGKAEIARYLRAVCDGNTTRRVGNGVSSEERIAFSETCEYPDGTWIVVKTRLELREGEIVRQVDVVKGRGGTLEIPPLLRQGEEEDAVGYYY